MTDLVSHIDQNTSFEISREDFRMLAHKLIDSLLDVQEKSASGLYPENKTSDHFKNRFEQHLPRNGKSPQDVFKFFEKEISPLLFNAMQPKIAQLLATPVGLLSLVDLISGFMNIQPYAQVNQHIESLVIKWLSEMVNYRNNCHGIMTSGGSVSNFYALSVARVNKLPYNIRKEGYKEAQLIVYTSTECHSSINKSIELSGIGNENLRIIDADKNFRIETQALIMAIEADIVAGKTPFCIVANLGSVRTGSVDPVADLAEIADKYDLWLHLDGAYGAFGALCEERREFFLSVRRADSITIDPHKWLNIPLESSCLLVRDKQCLQDTFDYVPDYLGVSPFDKDNPLRYSFELTKSDKSLKTWFALNLFGSDSYADLVTKHIVMIENFAEKISNIEDFELLCKPDLSICCFRFVPRRLIAEKNKYNFYLNNLNSAIKSSLNIEEDFLITSVKINGTLVLRVCVINYKFEQSFLDQLIVSVREYGLKLDEKMSN